MNKFKTIAKIHVGEGAQEDSNLGNLSAIVVRREQGTYVDNTPWERVVVFVVGGLLPDGEDIKEFSSTADAMQYAYGVASELVEELED